MTSLLHSGKFWLKLLVISMVSLLVIFVLCISGLHYLFNEERISHQINGIMSGTGYRVNFNKNINRSWFPRPTVTLHDVQIINNRNQATEISVGNMKVGLGWQSLMGRTVIEKWQLNHLYATALHDSDHQWNLQQLWQSLQQKRSHWRINRLVIDDGTVRIRHQDQSWLLDHLYVEIKNVSRDKHPVTAHGLWQGRNFPVLQWQLNGIHYSSNQWQNVQLDIQTENSILGKSSGQWNFDAQWLPEQQRLQTGAVQWRWQSQKYQIHANGTGKNWQLSWTSILLPQLNAVMTADNTAYNTVNISLNANQILCQNNHWSIQQFQLESGWQNAQYQSSVSLGGQLSWLDNHTWQLGNLTVNSHQDSIDGLPNQRFISDLSGNLTGDTEHNINLNLQGQFDNQPLNINMAYQPNQAAPVLAGSIQLAQLNLRPYLPETRKLLTDNGLQLWRHWLKRYTLDWQISIDHITTNSLLLNQLKTHLTGNHDALTLSPINVQMYDGTSTGQLYIRNRPTLSWQLDQQLHNIQMKPFLQDVFNFHNIDGKGNGIITLNSQGMNTQQWLSALNGKIDLQLQQGLFQGIDIDNILQNKPVNTLMVYNETSQTPFKLLKLYIPIKNGQSQDSFVSLKADHFDVKGQGNLNLPLRLTDYLILIAAPGYNQQTLLPLRINGSITHPNFTIDYQRLTAGLHSTEQKQESVRQTFKQQWLWFNQGNSNNAKTWPTQP